MKKIIASVGLAAVGASSLHAAAGVGMEGDTAKPWSIAATLRGFYDDNVNTSSANRQESFGFEVSPTFRFNWVTERTTIGVGYTYSLKYYEHQPLGNTDHFDQTHLFNFSVDQVFSPRYRLRVQDSFVIGQEPDTLRAGETPLSQFQRIPGNNIRNYGSIVFDAQITHLFGVELGYANSFTDYEDSGNGTATIEVAGGEGPTPATEIVPSLSGVLDRIEHMVWVDTRWMVAPQTTAIIGGRARQVEYTADEEISGVTSEGGFPGDIAPIVRSRDRNFREYSGYVGAEHRFRPDLSASAKVGASYSDYYNDPRGDGDGWSPFANASLRWTYMPDDYLEVGLTHDLNATDVAGQYGGHTTRSAESTVFYVNVTHHITPKLVGNLNGQFQNSTFNGGDNNDKSERYYLAGVNLEYRFTPNFSAQVGYNYDRLESEIGGRSFDRNRVYIGVTAGY